MVQDLSDLNVDAPAGTDLVSEGDNTIRDTRLYVRNWADVEHHRTGEHKFKYGAPAAKPAAGNAGRIYLNTSDGRLERDDGTIWRMLSVAQPSLAYTAGSIELPATYLSIASLSVTVPEGARVGVFGSFEYENGDAGAGHSAGAKLSVGGLILGAHRFFYAGPEITQTCTLIGLSEAKAAGTYAVALSAYELVWAGYALAWGRTLIAVVL